MTDTTARVFDRLAVKGLIERLLKVSAIGCKSVWVGRSGSILVTFYSLAAAREALTVLGQFAGNLKLGDGYDATLKGHSRVWRIAGLMGT